MKKKPFVHLHLHTSYSLLDGSCRVEDVMTAAAKNDMPAVAITDHGVMYGVIDFYQQAVKKGIKPIIGCETYITSGSRLERKTEKNRSYASHLVLLAADLEGYHNLVRLVSAAHLEGFYYKPRIDREILARHHKGLIGLSACLKGETAGRLVDDDMKGAVPEQRKVNALTVDLAARTKLPYVATNDVHYLSKEHADAHEVLLCLQTSTFMSDPKRMRYPTKEFYFKTREEMDELFKAYPGAVDTSLEVADRCGVELEFGKLHFPEFRVPDGTTQAAYLAQKTTEGITRRYGIADPRHPRDEREREVMDRYDSELRVIEKTGFVNYFLVVWDFVRFAREAGIPVGPGRGSGGGSLIAYALGITAIDPIRYNLIFERFLNPERVSPPDFDIDFCQARRGEVIQYVKQKYGRENVAQIITFGSLGAKTVIRDVGRVLEIPYAKCDQLSKLVPEELDITLKTALEKNPEFLRAYDTDPDCKRILDYGFVLEGLYRNTGIHAAGVVIGEKPLTEIIPLALDKDKQIITQYAMEAIGKIGLLKTLTVLHEAVELVKEYRKVELDLENLPLDNKPTYDLLNRGDTVGVFQLESSGMRDLIRRIGIDRIEDLIAMIALYRPGPMNMLPDYVDRKTGKAKVKYDHPSVEPILKETYGVMVYQEQVQKVASVLAGYSLGKADSLRRAMAKKLPEEMEKQREVFVDGCKKTGVVNAKDAGRIFDTMKEFAGYGFNKAHSTGYAIIAYQTAYLKANYPADFMAALLSSEIGNADKIPVFVAEAREMELEILPPDVNASDPRFKPTEDSKGIRFGLAGIKNVGEGAAEAIAAERKAAGPYAGLSDFCGRINSQLVNKKVIESLVRAGAFDPIETNRARLFNAIDIAMARAASAQRDRKSGQSSLFDMMPEARASETKDDFNDCPPWRQSELLAGERELLGLYMSGHPLTQYASLLQRYQLTSVSKLETLQERTLTRLGGIVTKLVKRVTKNKENMASFNLEDLDGDVEVVVFPNAYTRFGAFL